MEMFCVLIVLMVTWFSVFVKPLGQDQEQARVSCVLGVTALLYIQNLLPRGELLTPIPPPARWGRGTKLVKLTP